MPCHIFFRTHKYWQNYYYQYFHNHSITGNVLKLPLIFCSSLQLLNIISLAILHSYAVSVLPSSSAFFLRLFEVGPSSFHPPCSPVLCFFYIYSFRHSTSFLSYFSVPTHFHVLITTYFFRSFSPRGPSTSVSLLLFSDLCLPHLPLLLFLHSSSFQSTLFPSSISTFSFLFFLCVASFAQTFSVPRSHLHTLEQASFRHVLYPVDIVLISCCDHTFFVVEILHSFYASNSVT